MGAPLFLFATRDELRATDPLSESFSTSVFRARGPVAEWRSTLLFLFAAQIFNKDAEWGLGLLDRLLARLDRATVKAEPWLAAFIAEALQLCLAKNYRVPEALAEVFRRLGREAIEDEIELQARQAIGLCLGRLGDPRIPGLRDPSAYVEVPAGNYPYGDKKKTVVKIAAPFRLGRYPVTNRQFQDFLEDRGYEKQQWWSDAGWGVAARARGDGACAPPAVERPKPAGGGGKLLGGRGLQQMGRRAAAAGTGMGGRRPRRARLCISLGQ